LNKKEYIKYESNYSLIEDCEYCHIILNQSQAREILCR